MKQTIFLGLLVLLISAQGRALAGEQFSLIDVPVRKAYIPVKGYDDNDFVEVVVEGTLPNPCYTLGKAVVGPVIGPNLEVRQLAWKNNSPDCDINADDPVPFTSVASFGMLKHGDYGLRYALKQGSSEKKFKVDEAPTKDLDNFNYASIQTADLEKVFYEGDEVIARLHGVWTNKCQQLEPLVAERQDDLFVVRPILSPPGALCEKTLAPFSEPVSLGRLEKGTYLLHVRSRGGKAVYLAFQVWPRL